MTGEERMMLELEKARKLSEDGCTVYALTDGVIVWYTKDENLARENAYDDDWWICSIFEYGHRVEA